MTTERQVPIREFDLGSGDIALDFANTLDPRRGRAPVDRIPDYRFLLAFAAASGLMDETAREELALQAAARPHEAAAVHATALALREAIFGVAASVATGGEPGSADLRTIQQLAAGAFAAGRILYQSEGFRWTWDDAGTALERPVWPIASSAVRLLTRQDLARLRICAADDCDWLFIDETRNHSRKWCDMSTCGNRAKVARYRERRE